jgi:hypothetical protein
LTRFEYFFGKAIRITSDGPATIPDIIQAHLSLCEQNSWCSSICGHEGQSSFRVPPLFRAIIVILEHRDQSLCPGLTRKSTTLDYLLLNRSILLVRTGEESELSAPISFESLEPITATTTRPCPISSKASNFNSIRVSQGAVAKFMLDLQHRENAALSSQIKDRQR